MGRRTPQSILPDLATVQKENDILDSLATSFAGAAAPIDDSTEPKKKKKKKKVKKDEPKVFDVDLILNEDKSLFKTIDKMFRSTARGNHVTRDYSIEKIYQVTIANMRDAFMKYGATLPDIRQLWHGTKASNLLSIMRQGLVIPSSGAGHTTGRMFGDGVYASSISTKALNYATNFWGSGGDTSRVFMFLLDMAMGKYHLAGGYGGRYPQPGTNSTWAKGGHGGVQNDEMIVYRLDQCNLLYLVEFKDRS